VHRSGSLVRARARGSDYPPGSRQARNEAANLSSPPRPLGLGLLYGKHFMLYEGKEPVVQAHHQRTTGADAKVTRPPLPRSWKPLDCAHSPISRAMRRVTQSDQFDQPRLGNSAATGAGAEGRPRDDEKHGRRGDAKAFVPRYWPPARCQPRGHTPEGPNEVGRVGVTDATSDQIDGEIGFDKQRRACAIRRSLIHSCTGRPVLRRTIVVRWPLEMLTAAATSGARSARGSGSRGASGCRRRQRVTARLE
jgi:hypothetical protein